MNQLSEQTNSKFDASSDLSPDAPSDLSPDAPSDLTPDAPSDLSPQANMNSRSSSHFRNLYLFLLTRFRNDTGSAIVEFTVLAIPLFVPIVIYLGVIHDNSRINTDLHNLARQSARAFITSTSDTYEEARLQSVLSAFVAKVFKADGISEVPVLNVQCSASPCLTPDSKVKVTATLTRKESQLSGMLRFLSSPTIEFSASDTQVVDAWR